MDDPVDSAIGPPLSVEARFKLALEEANDAVVCTDARGRVQWCNARFAAVTLKPRDQVLGIALVDLLPLGRANGRPPGEHPITTVLKGHSRLSASYVLNKEGGTTTYWQLAGSWVVPPNQEPLAVFWLHEVTAQVLNERARNRLAAIQSAVQESVVCWDLDGIITHWNAAAERTYGYGPQEAVGKSHTMLVPAEGRAQFDEVLAHVLKGEAPAAFEANRKRKDGRLIQISARVLGWPDENGRLCGFVDVAHDITERRQSEAVLAHQMDELVRSNRQLEEFASTVSHDLLAPLRKIIGFGGLLEKRVSEKLDEEGLGLLKRITDAASRMTRLIEDLLRFSRVFGDSRPLEPVDLAAIVREAVSDLEAQVSQAEAVVEIAALPTIQARPFQMRQLFQNLIGNALKFRSKAAIPRVSVESGLERAGFIDILVRDNGIGFDQKDADKIFEPFVRLHALNEYEGTGIGLAVCRRIMLRYGGWIHAQSEPGRGATFTVSFPVRAKPQDAAASTINRADIGGPAPI